MILVAIFGSECTGKTTMAQMLAEKLNTYWVPEYAREYALRTPELTVRDVLPIMHGQIQLEQKVTAKAVGHQKKVVICDTIPLSSLVYSQYYYRHVPPEAEQLADRHYDLYLLTGVDVPWQDDQARGKNINRQIMHTMFAEALTDRRLPYQLLKGDEKQRLSQALHCIESCLQQK